MWTWSQLQQLIAACPAPIRSQFDAELPTVLLPDLGRWATAWAVAAQNQQAPRPYAR